jgi:hypothetical protein
MRVSEGRSPFGPMPSSDAVKSGGFLAGGRAEDIVKQPKTVERRYSGLDRVICATPPGTLFDVQLEDLRRFAKAVVPALRNTRIAAAVQEVREATARGSFGGTSASPAGRISNTATHQTSSSGPNNITASRRPGSKLCRRMNTGDGSGLLAL